MNRKAQRPLQVICGLLFLGLLGCGGSREAGDISAVPAMDSTQIADASGTTQQEVLAQKKMDVLEAKTRIDILQDEITNLKTEVERLESDNKELQNRLKSKEGQTGLQPDDSSSQTYRELLITRNQQRAENAAIAAEIANSDTAVHESADLTGMLDPISKDEYRNRYNKALNEYFQGNFYRAIAEFQTLLVINKSNSYADNAQYWIAESYYSMEDYQKALKEFEQVLEFPDTNKGDDAQFKKALCYLRMGNQLAAQREFEQLKKRYPESDLLPKVAEYMESPEANVR